MDSAPPARPAHKGDKAGIPAHHLHHVDPLVASGRVPDLVDPVDHGVERRVKADGNVGAGDVVVDGGGNADGGHALPVKASAPRKEPSPPMTTMAAIPARAGARRPVCRPSAVLNSGAGALQEVPPRWMMSATDWEFSSTKLPVHQAVKAPLDADDLGPSARVRSAHDRPDGGVHARAHRRRWSAPDASSVFANPCPPLLANELSAAARASLRRTSSSSALAPLEATSADPAVAGEPVFHQLVGARRSSSDKVPQDGLFHGRRHRFRIAVRACPAAPESPRPRPRARAGPGRSAAGTRGLRRPLMSRQRICAHISGEITEYQAFSSISTRSPTPMASAPPLPPSPVMTQMIGHFQEGHAPDGLGDDHALSSLFRLDARIGPDDVDEGDDRPAELLRLLHEAHRLPVSFRMRQAEVAPDVLFRVFCPSAGRRR